MNFPEIAGRIWAVCSGIVLGLWFLPAALAAPAEETQAAGGGGMYSTYIDTGSRRYFSDALRKPFPMAMEDLLPALMDAIDRLSRYPVPEGFPPVHRVAHEKIEELACGGACAALAVYRPGEGIYLDESLMPETDVFARSVLLHELVHYVQDVADNQGEVESCDRWVRREQQAYSIQMRFLSLAGSETVVAAYMGLTNLGCPSEVNKPAEAAEPQV
jgi:hypothetical protein